MAFLCEMGGTAPQIEKSAPREVHSAPRESKTAPQESKSAPREANSAPRTNKKEGATPSLSYIIFSNANFASIAVCAST